MNKQRVVALLLFSSVTSCSERGDAASTRSDRHADSSGGAVVSLAGSQPYRAVALTSVGSIAGTVAPAGAALVWVDEITAGKPVGEILRRTVTIENGEFVPHIQDVPTGTTINVFTKDRAAHIARFHRGEELVAEIRTMDAGQVVPSETIANRAGLVEMRAQDQSQARAYIAAFDHPYHAVTDASGAFRIDSLPPGTYIIKVWREGLAEPLAHRVVVTAGGVGRVDLSLGPAPAPATLSAGDTIGDHRDE